MPDLRSLRPRVVYGDVWCEVCNLPCDFAEYGTHQGNFKNDGPLLTGKGAVHILATCHGEQAEMSISFEALHKMGYGSGGAKQKIVAFTTPSELSLSPETPLLSERGQEAEI